ncbi:class I SAM-dependent methyltransferase [Variovorax rhizosphaerae]|uniref:Class I SAM-dependent methyltransferase n=1 Tax=Variovorax rhizosphaerae TaxID=1836200 RepID=A0ABU8X045_9BURK
MTTNFGVRRRESFDEVARLYDSARPGYPRALINDLLDFTALREGGRVLEIGCGIGQLTVPLAELEVFLVAVELGANLADVAREKLSRFGRAEVIVADFDQWVLPDQPFDLVVAATAFHWLDPDRRIQKCVYALRPGGTLAVIDTHWGVRTGDDPFLRQVSHVTHAGILITIPRSIPQYSRACQKSALTWQAHGCSPRLRIGAIEAIESTA